jgi:hypothetical protein
MLPPAILSEREIMKLHVNGGLEEELVARKSVRRRVEEGEEMADEAGLLPKQTKTSDKTSDKP